MTFYYDPSSGPLTVACRLQWTVVPHVLGRFEFWLFLVLHLGIYIAFNNGYLEDAAVKKTLMYVEWQNVKVITALTTFFEVFYTNQCWSRYVHLFKTTRLILSGLHDFVFELRLNFCTEGSSKFRWQSARYVVLCIRLYFIELCSETSDVSDKDWEELIAKCMVTHDERDYLETLGREQRLSVLICLAAEVARKGVEDQKLATNVLKGYVSCLERIRKHMQEVTDTVELPIPFQYFHLLNMMVVMNTVTWAYAMGITQSVFAPMVYFFAALIFMGMLALGSQLSNPFGEDEVDFPVNDWVAESITMSGVLLEYEFADAKDGWKSPLKNHSRFEFDEDADSDSVDDAA